MAGPGGALACERRVEAPAHQLALGAVHVLAELEEAERELAAPLAQPLHAGLLGHVRQPLVLGAERLRQARQVTAGEGW